MKISSDVKWGVVIVLVIISLFGFAEVMGQRQTQSITSKGTVERWYVGKVLTKNDETLVLVACGGLIHCANFEYYPSNAAVPVSLSVYYLDQFEFAEQSYILLSAIGGYGYIEVVRVNR